MNFIKKVWHYRRDPIYIIKKGYDKTIVYLYHKLIRNTFQHVSRMLAREKRVLIYCGLNRGGGFDRIFRKYHVCYGFEADPDLYEYCKHKFKGHKSVNIIHGALNTFDGEVTFHLSNNRSASSSLSKTFASGYHNADAIQYIKEITVPSVHLYNFCQKNYVRHITQYVSDIEGMDFEVLKTLKPMLDEKRIQCEVALKPLHPDLPSNRLEDYESFLASNYELTASGWGILKEGVFLKVPDEFWGMDCLWSLRD